MESLGFSIYNIMSPANTDNFTYSFPIRIPYFFLILIAPARTSNTMLNKSGKSGHPCLVSDLRGKSYGLYYAEVHSLCTGFIECFYHKILNGHWLLSNASSASIGMIWFLSFISLMWCITLIDLPMLNHPYIPRLNLAWLWCMILLMYCWIQLADICWVFLHLCSSGILTYHFLFLWHPCSVLVSSNAGLIKWFWKSSYIFYYLEGFEKDWY